MFGRNKKESKKEKKRNEFKDETNNYLQKETLNAIIAVVFFVLAVFLILSSGPIDKAGKVGTFSYKIFHYLFGVGYYLLPILFFILCVSFFRSLQKRLALTHTIGGTLFFISSLALVNILSQSSDGIGSGGVIGGFISKPLINMFDTYVSVIILVALIVISLLTIFDAPIRFTFLKSLFQKKEILPGTEDAGPEVIISNGEILTEKEQKEMSKPEEDVSSLKKQVEAKDEFGISPLLLNGKEFVPPPLSLLLEDRGKPGVGDIKANSNIIKRTLANFGINVEMDEISIGPSITRYALKPAEGVKLSRIVGLQNDLALALAAHPIRIEAPIPGKSLVGIEIPNSVKTTVGLGTLLSSNE